MFTAEQYLNYYNVMVEVSEQEYNGVLGDFQHADDVRIGLLS